MMDNKPGPSSLFMWLTMACTLWPRGARRAVMAARADSMSALVWMARRSQLTKNRSSCAL
ncbi:hypothetical protein THSYN_31635 (plasmid) [Candidatus Thiodictyon syntrophicum]|uniref:Uncharacterized protein n=1 Tax=Candidatus Thiodictyon syntrophicum TaxID=1166950 RepID=A0A2K8UIU0_9GAMM|nr:hypothetical protein THSYN_31635 [Candidatus Thiodictyon syntrophicum]